MPSLSLVLPAYNEEENLVEAVQQAQPHLDAITPGWEIVVVNDGSTDATGALADGLALESGGRIRVVHLTPNGGLGAALRAGFAAARGDVLVYCDSDLPFDMVALTRAHALLEETGADIVTGYRTNRETEGLRRHLYSAAYNALARTLFGLKVRDVNFSLKMFRRTVAEHIGLASRGSFIDVEFLARAHGARFRIAQLGVVYTPRTRGVSTLARPSVIVGILNEMQRYVRGRLEPAGPLAASPPSGDSLPSPSVTVVLPTLATVLP
ncbi:MAG TPA: glycosyltransferase family 2 protein [Rhodothermales bacterium]|nr:glycosyltransferase family 2 protein [Rhodothermales bacterium]